MLNFDLLDSHTPFYQKALGDRLEYELTINDYSRMIQATGDIDAYYRNVSIGLEDDIVTQQDLSRMFAEQYKHALAGIPDLQILYVA